MSDRLPKSGDHDKSIPGAPGRQPAPDQSIVADAPGSIVGDAPDNDGPPISPLVPASMHRAEADALAIATSPDFSERPDGATVEPPEPPSPSPKAR